MGATSATGTMLRAGLGSDEKKRASLCPWETRGLARETDPYLDQPSGQAAIEDKDLEKGVGEGATEVTSELGL